MSSARIVPLTLVLLVGVGLAAAQDWATGDGTDSTWIEAWSDEGAPDAPAGESVTATNSYYHVLGTALRPRGGTSTYEYGGNGCVYVTGGSNVRLQFPVTIPDGSEILYVRIYYNDTSAGDMTVWLTKYQPGQSNTDLTSVSSSGSAGYGTALSPLVGEIVDNVDNYTLNFGWNANDSTQQICGVRINYTAP